MLLLLWCPLAYFGTQHPLTCVGIQYPSTCVGKHHCLAAGCNTHSCTQRYSHHWVVLGHCTRQGLFNQPERSRFRSHRVACRWDVGCHGSTAGCAAAAAGWISGPGEAPWMRNEGPRHDAGRWMTPPGRGRAVPLSAACLKAARPGPAAQGCSHWHCAQHATRFEPGSFLDLWIKLVAAAFQAALKQVPSRQQQ